MAAKDKVGSWLGDKKPCKSEAYDSDSAESDITEPDAPAKKAASSSSSSSDSDSDSDSDSSSDSDSDEDDAKEGRERNIDWDTVLPKVRPALLDRSAKRRDTFIARYLYVTDECRLVRWHRSRQYLHRRRCPRSCRRSCRRCF